MQFVYPVIFYLVLGILLPALVIIALWARWQRQRDLRVFGNQSLVDQLIQDLSNTRRVLKGLALLAGLFLLGLSLAGPQYGVKMVEVLRQGVDVIIILDVSQSMLAEDVRPNRLERAQQELGAFIDHLGGDRVGIIAFAGSAQVACPLTTDYVAAKMFLNYLSPQSVSVAGTELGTAIRAGLEIFPEGSEGYRVLVLLTDGEDHDSKVIEAAQEAKAAGVKILSIGFGSPGGEPIPIRNAKGEIVDYVKDKNGKTVMSRLDEATLKKITDMTGGILTGASRQLRSQTNCGSYSANAKTGGDRRTIRSKRESLSICTFARVIIIAFCFLVTKPERFLVNYISGYAIITAISLGRHGRGG